MNLTFFHFKFFMIVDFDESGGSCVLLGAFDSLYNMKREM